MALDKYDIQKGTCQKLGASLEDLLEGSKGTVSEAKGAQRAVLEMKKNVAGIVTVTKDETKDLSPEEAKPVMKALGRVQESLESFVMKCKAMEISAAGQVQALAMAVKLVKKEHDTIEYKQASRKEAEENPDVIDIRRRPTGVRPTGVQDLRNRDKEPGKEEAKEEAKAPAPKKKRGRKKVEVPTRNGVPDAPNT